MPRLAPYGVQTRPARIRRRMVLGMILGLAAAFASADSRLDDYAELTRWAFSRPAVFSQDQSGTALVFIDQPEKDFSFPLPKKPKKVVFNPDNAVLARMKKR